MIGQPSIADIRALVREAVENAVPALIKQMHDEPPRGDLTRAFLGFQGGTLVWRQLPDQPPVPGAPVEWAQRVDAENEAVKVNAAPVMHANRAIGSESEQSVSFSSLSENDQRWLFIEIDMVASTATAKFSESADVPTDDPDTGKIRWRLSKWKRTATGVSLVRSAWPGGVINIPSVYGPQTW